MRFISIGLACALVALATPFTARGNIVFFFAGAEANVDGQTLPAFSGSNTLTVKPTGHVGTLNNNTPGQAFRTPFGLGVRNPNPNPPDPLNDRSFFFNSFHVDGNDPEFLRLEFSEPIKLLTVVFTNAGPGSTDRFGLAVDGVAVNVPAVFGTDIIKDLRPPGLAAGIVRIPDAVPTGKTFAFLASNWGPATFDEWNVEKVEVVPEPATLLVFSALGLGIVGWCHKRRRTKRRPAG
jgi:hypothetical protein